MTGTKFLFYDPCVSGVRGATVPVPDEVLKVAERIAGKQMTLQEATEAIQAVTDGAVRVSHAKGLIGLTITDPDGTEHGFRVVRFKDAA